MLHAKLHLPRGRRMAFLLLSPFNHGKKLRALLHVRKSGTALKQLAGLYSSPAS